MTARRGTGLRGILLIDKPAGMTSHDVVARVRRATGEKRIGHAGTLDPAATGVLVTLIGPYARLANRLTAQTKSYEARIVFGTATDTDDAEGSVVREAPVPAEAADAAFAQERVAALIGMHEQRPPVFSAIKTDGTPAYRDARAGREVELAPRTIEVVAARLLVVESGPPVSWSVELTVSKGTYIRAIARDVGEELGTAAHLAGLRRTTSGSAGIDDTVTLEAIESADYVTALFADPLSLLGLAVIELDDQGAADVADGRPLRDLRPDAPETVALTRDGELRAVYARAEDGSYRAEVVFPEVTP